MKGEAREVELRGKVGEARPFGILQGSKPAKVDVEAAVGCGDLDIQGLSRRRERCGKLCGDDWRMPRKHRFGDRATVDLDDLVASRRHEADTGERPGMAGVQRHPATTLAMGVDETLDRHLDAGRPQRAADIFLLPGAVGESGHVLRRAAAAPAEIGTERNNPLGRGGYDLDEMAASAVALDGHVFARQRVGNEDLARGRIHDAVAAGAEPRDLHLFSHVAPRAGTRGCRRRRQSARG